MPTLAQLKEFLTAMGVPLAPDFVLEALLEVDPDVQACLEAQGLSPAKILLVYLYLFTLLALPASYRYISSQTAPSGASQSFRYTNEADAFRNVRSLLYGLDKTGCTWGLIPETGNTAGLWVSTGGKCC
jgi:hypothetical protein